MESYERTGWRQKFYRRGVQVGYFRDVSPCGKILEFGVVGSTVWRFAFGGSLVIAKKDNDGKFCDHDGVYLYPGFELGLSVDFVGGRMVRGRESTPAYIKQNEFGLPCIKMRNVKNSRLLEYENQGSHIPAKNCLLRDLWDIMNVYVAPSSLDSAGEGLYARRNIPEGSLVCLFSGARKRQFRNEFFEFSDYCIKVDDTCSIDIPDHFVSVSNYSATLGHKACHSFTNNGSFNVLYHPRFGKIMAIFALSHIKKDEEIFVSYNYSIATAPAWYQQVWLTYLRKERGWSKDDVMENGVNSASNANLFNRIDAKTKQNNN